MKIFTLYDCKAETYHVPFYCPTAAVALRNIEAATNDPNENLAKFASDYTLFELGEFNQDEGTFEIHEAKINLGTAIQFQKPALAVAE